ncbi:MAG: glycine dehydrogenase (aminomethyl-transferring) [Bacteroidia bacterium]|nr:MAG: glycine dehydrogenase (aminomethyl-transferring) [Bacteroidia bacterium]
MLSNKFEKRHIGPREHDISKMLEVIGVNTIDDLIFETIPSRIEHTHPLNLPEEISEFEYLNLIKKIASKNKIFRTYIGQGYYGTVTPAVILRNVFENPGWYTSYTPYQAEVSQGRLEALLNFQTVICDLTAMELSNCSLLDEATAAAEAMIMMFNARSRAMVKKGVNKIFVDENIFPQTLDVLNTRSKPLGIEIVSGDFRNIRLDDSFFGTIVQYPAANGEIVDYKNIVEDTHKTGGLVSVVVDIMSLALLTPPGEWNADIVVGSTQRFGIPLGFGGPHAGYLACREKFKRNMPGRIIGVSKDMHGNPALRMALQTREQHIKRERATSNICTAQALLATMAGFYAIYHGKEGITEIANSIHNSTYTLANKLKQLGFTIENSSYFDTLSVKIKPNAKIEELRKEAERFEINFFYKNADTVSISLDETVRLKDLNDIIRIFAKISGNEFVELKTIDTANVLGENFKRKSDFLSNEVFKKYRSETEMMRYMKKLERRDISLNHSMISLGSCTMKLNAAAEMIPISLPEFTNIHPFVPKEQALGYHRIFEELEAYLSRLTGFVACTLQPNSGAAGEYTGLMLIREYHIKRGDKERNLVLIPASAHGTNPASAVMAGMKVVVVPCDEKGNIDVNKLRELAMLHQDKLAAFMVTYPSTHGVFETDIMDMCKIIHENGGLVYMDGANMNAQVGITSPGFIGADVCHLNLHKTFAIPHGGGGPGVGPICVAKHLAEFLPGHKLVETGGENAISAVSAAPFGSANVLPITYGYLKMLGLKGLTKSTKMAILNANYLASSLQKHGFKIYYTGVLGRVAHEMILDCHSFKNEANITETDIAKRLMDYGFHAPTLSFPVHGTLMIEPTESESLEELDRFIEAMVSIKQEIEEVKNGTADAEDNVLKNAPHTAQAVINDEWKHSYSRKKAAFPLKWIEENKFWPYVGRVDDAHGDRNLICTAPPLESYTEK